MDTPLTPEARRELLQVLRPRYQASRSRTKKQILKELIAATGYHEKYALRLLNGPPVKAQEGPRYRRRTPLYDEAVKKVLVEVWEVLDRSCSKILKAAMPRTLDSLEHHQHLTLDGIVRTQLLDMSASTIDRQLRSIRNADATKKRRRVVPRDPSPHPDTYLWRLEGSSTGQHGNGSRVSLRWKPPRQLYPFPGVDRYRQWLDGVRGTSGAR